MITRINPVTSKFINQLAHRFWGHYYPASKGYHYFEHPTKGVTLAVMQSFLDRVLGDDNPISFIDVISVEANSKYDHSNPTHEMFSQLPDRLTVTPMDLLEAIEKRVYKKTLHVSQVAEFKFDSSINEVVNLKYAQESDDYVYYNHNLALRLLLQPNSTEIYQVAYALGKETEIVPSEWKMLDEEYFHALNTPEGFTYHDSERLPDMWDLANLINRLMIKDLEEEEKELESQLHQHHEWTTV
jgi:hypothetical protein